LYSRQQYNALDLLVAPAVLPFPLYEISSAAQAHTQEQGCRGAAHPSNRKHTDFVNTILSNISRDLHFSRNQPLKPTGDHYDGIKKKYKVSD